MPLASEAGPQAQAPSAATTTKTRITDSVPRSIAGVAAGVRSLLVAGVLVRLQQVRAEIAIEIAPHGVNVIRAVLRVVKFDQEGVGLYAIIMRIAAVHAACPREVNVLARLLDLIFPDRGQLIRHVADVLVEK